MSRPVGRALAADERRTRALLPAVVADDHRAAAAHGDAEALAGPAGEHLVRRAAQHRVSRALHASSVRRLLGAGARAELEDQCLASVADQLRILVTGLPSVAAALASLPGRWLVVKGPVAAHLLHARPELRQYVDLDVVVDPADFPRAVALLEAVGARLIDRNWPLLRSERRGQVHLRMPDGTEVDLHWDLLNRSQVRTAFAVPTTRELLESGRDVEVGGMLLRTLDRESTLLHLCLHAALSGGHRLTWLRDVDRAVVAAGPSWDVVVRRAHDWRARAAVGAMLLRSSSVFGTPVPEPVVRALLPPPRAGALRLVDRALPVPAARTDRSLLAVCTPLVRDRGFGVSPQMRRSLEGRSRRATITDVPAGRDEHGQRTAYMADVRRGRT